jgi:hypothetical protein
MARKYRSIAAVIGAVSVLGLGGVAIAASDESNDRAATVAQALSAQTGTEITTEDVLAAQKQVATDRVEQALADGRITQDEADSLLERIESGEHIRGGLHGGPGFGPGGPIGGVAEDLGLDQDALREALRDGQSLAEFAEGQGVTRDQVVSAIEDSMIEKAEERGVDAPDGATLSERAESIADGDGARPGPFAGPPPADLDG